MSYSQVQVDPNQTDFLSNLPDALLLTILSFLPTPTAARTSVLCRRFRHLWEASPSVQISTYNPHKFIAMADRVLLRRNPSHPLLTLHLDLYKFSPSLPDSYVPSLLAKARSLRLRHLIIKGRFDFVRLLPTIFSIRSLESLLLPAIGLDNSRIFPTTLISTCIRLKSLSLGFCGVDPAELGRILPQLRSLEDLHLEIHNRDKLSLSSQTIRKLKLIIGLGDRKLDTLELFLPSLESLHLENWELYPNQFHIHVEVPLLKRAVIIFDEACARNAITRLLNAISHVEELSLHVKDETQLIPSSILWEPEKRMPNYPNLKNLNVSLCFHELNFQAVLIMLHKCPALESLKLIHEIPMFTGWAEGRKKEDWASELPSNGDGNNNYAYFTNLHLGKNRKEIMRLLNKAYL
ncbi:hypothetical protein LUZ61_013336 [Rhynchospora tenuis]|uniref:F-box domain-containing protein n=1 Tax=Rhynchospora tenuis TaxID=198213 RepID=A0AAD5Z1M8_9POAL|nr:hypothetical protein LUZ61_013336 [Rhynchospora tenuis]